VTQEDVTHQRLSAKINQCKKEQIASIGVTSINIIAMHASAATLPHHCWEHCWEQWQSMDAVSTHEINKLLWCTHAHNQPLLSLHKTFPVPSKRRQTSQTVKGN